MSEKRSDGMVPASCGFPLNVTIGVLSKGNVPDRPQSLSTKEVMLGAVDVR